MQGPVLVLSTVGGLMMGFPGVWHQFSPPDISNPTTTSPPAKKYWVQVPLHLICEVLKVIHVIFGVYKPNSFPAECILPQEWDQGNNRGREDMAHPGKTEHQQEFSTQFQPLPGQGFHQTRLLRAPSKGALKQKFMFYLYLCLVTHLYMFMKKTWIYFHEILPFWAAPCGSSAQSSPPPPGIVLFLVRQTHQFQ